MVPTPERLSAKHEREMQNHPLPLLLLYQQQEGGKRSLHHWFPPEEIDILARSIYMLPIPCKPHFYCVQFNIPY